MRGSLSLSLVLVACSRGMPPPPPPETPPATEGHDGDGARRDVCEAQNPVSCFELGEKYRDGNGVHVDDQRAAAFFKTACVRGFAAGCMSLGGMAMQGRGGMGLDLWDAAMRLMSGRPGAPSPVDRAHALYRLGCELYRKACDGGDGNSCYKLGIATLKGEGVERDLAAAAVLMEKGCTLGEGSGCFDLGTMYERGDGVPKDATKARDYRAKACAAGVQRACSEAP